MIEFLLLYPNPRHPLRHAAEMLPLLLVAALVMAVPDFPFNIIAMYSSWPPKWPVAYSPQGVVLCQTILNLGFLPLVAMTLILARSAPRWRAFTPGLLAIAFALPVAVFLIEHNLRLGAAQLEDIPSPFGYSFPAPVWLGGWRKYVEWAIPLAVALVGRRGEIALAKALPRLLVAQAILAFAFHGDFILHTPADVPMINRNYEIYALNIPMTFGLPFGVVILFQSTLMILLSVLAILFPLQRAGWVGLRERARLDLRVASVSLLSVGAIAFLCAYGRYEWKLGRFLNDLREITPAPTPGARNAFVDLKGLFSAAYSADLEATPVFGATFKVERSRFDHKITYSSPCDDFDLITPDPAELQARAIELMDREQFKLLEAELRPYYEALCRATGADCLIERDGDEVARLSLNNLRGSIYLLGQSAMIKLHDGDEDGSLRDIETMLRVGHVVGKGADLFPVMFGVALERIAESTAFNYYIAKRTNPGALDKLEGMLSRNRRTARIPMPLERLRQADPSFLPIVPFASFIEESRGSRLRAWYTCHSAWVKADQLALALALEHYRRDHGRYPSRLKELAPTYMPQLPPDPLEGGDYYYENLGDEFIVRSRGLDRAIRRMPTNGVRQDLPFPISKIKNPVLEKEIESAIAKNAEKAAKAAGNGDAEPSSTPAPAPPPSASSAPTSATPQPRPTPAPRAARRAAKPSPAPR